MTDGILMSCVLCLLSSFGFLENDLYDIEVDRANAARRLERASPMALGVARRVALSLLLVSAAVAVILGPKCAMIAAAIAGGLHLYSARAKAVFLVGTSLASVLAASPLWVPIAASAGALPSPQMAVVVGCTMFLFAREIMLDVKDADGDRRVGRRTLPLVVGVEGALRTSSRCSVVAVLVLATAPLCQVHTGDGARLCAYYALLVPLAAMAYAPIQMLPGGDGDVARLPAYVRMSRRVMILIPLLPLLIRQ
jgi:4-hydroxybenzoate polyprenyltransferase